MKGGWTWIDSRERTDRDRRDDTGNEDQQRDEYFEDRYERDFSLEYD